MNNTIFIYKNIPYQKNYKIAVTYADTTMFHEASFLTIDQFELYKNTLGFEIDLKEVVNENTDREVKIYQSNYKIVSGSFWRLEDIPEEAKPIQALSNGSIVTCYYYKDEETKTIIIYRPNPNAKDVYKPLELEDHIEHQKKYGIY